MTTRLTWAVLLALLLAAPAAYGQLGVATITGRITDPSGAVVGGAAIVVTNTDTNSAYNTVANGEGIFRVPSLQPGPYRVTVEAAGFKRFVRDNLDLRAGFTLPVDATLEVGAVSEQVRVSAETPLLETETSAPGTALKGENLYNLPLFQRNVTNILRLVPGISYQGTSMGIGGGHVAGLRDTAIGVFEDGAISNNPLGSTGLVLPILNNVEDVKVLTTTLPAEYGNAAGGVIDIVRKGGTNEIHGLASGYGRARRMQHRLFFDQYKTSQPKAGFPNGEPTFFLLPDANVGGPVVLPKIYNGRNRTFFFFGWQKLIEKKSAQAYSNAPTPEMKAGDFSFGGVGNPLFDPASTRQLPNGTWVRDPLPDRRVPLSRFDPVARKVMDIDPWVAPNRVTTPNANGPVENIIYGEQARVFNEQYNGRIDHQIRQNVRLNGTWTYAHGNGAGRPPRNIRVLDFDAADGPTTPSNNQNFSIGTNWIINPSTISSTRVGYLRFYSQRFIPSYGKNWPGQLGIPNISNDLLPSFGIPGSGGLTGAGNAGLPESIYGLAVTGPFKRANETLSLRTDLTKIRGAHAFKMGYQVLRYRLNSFTLNYPSGDFRFDLMTADLQANGQPVPRTGNTFAGFLLGYVRQAQFTRSLANWYPRSGSHAFYFQDDWKFSPTLTFNLGVRYTNESPFGTKYGQDTNFDPKVIDPLTGRVGGLIHPTGALSGRDNNNFQPRIGLAWHPWQKWVFRGGLALSTVDIKYSQQNSQFQEYEALANYQQNPGDPRPIYRISQIPAQPAFNVRPDGTSPFLGTNYGARSAQFYDPNLRNPYAMNWNLTIQREMRTHYLVEFSYQGSAGVGLINNWEYNTFPIDFGANDPALRAAAFAAAQNYRPFPQFGSIAMRSNFGHSTYHSGSIKVEKRYSRGVNFVSFYTFSKSIDEQSNDNDGSGVAPISNRRLEKARSNYDRKHHLVGSVVWELPMGKGKKFLNRGGVWDRIFSGYEIAYVQTLDSGNPLNFDFAASPFNYYPTFAGSRRPNSVRPDPQLRDNYRDMGLDRFSAPGINAVMDIGYFGYPAAFTPGNLGRNVVTGIPLIVGQISAQKNIQITERFKFQVRWDYQNFMKTWTFLNPTTTVDLQNPQTFGKVRAEARTAEWGGQPIMHLTLALSF